MRAYFNRVLQYNISVAMTIECNGEGLYMCVCVVLQLVDRVLDVISQPGVQHLMSPERLCHSAGGGDHVHQGHHTWCDKKWHHVVPTLELWAAQLSALPVSQ